MLINACGQEADNIIQVMKKFLTKTGYLGLPQKGQKQVYDLQRIALTSLVHFAVQLHKVD